MYHVIGSIFTYPPPPPKKCWERQRGAHKKKRKRSHTHSYRERAKKKKNLSVLQIYVRIEKKMTFFFFTFSIFLLGYSNPPFFGNPFFWHRTPDMGTKHLDLDWEHFEGVGNGLVWARFFFFFLCSPGRGSGKKKKKRSWFIPLYLQRAASLRVAMLIIRSRN